jgi:hypothetical protein
MLHRYQAAALGPKFRPKAGADPAALVGRPVRSTTVSQ